MKQCWDLRNITHEFDEPLGEAFKFYCPLDTGQHPTQSITAPASDSNDKVMAGLKQTRTGSS